MKYGIALLLAFLTCLTLAPASMAQDVPGKVLASFPLTLKTPTGLAFDGTHLWLADFDTATLNEVDPATGKVLRSIEAPGYDPMGLAWDGEKLWVLDAADKSVYALDPKSGLTIKALPLDTDNPEGLAWDGSYLWVADARSGVIVRLDEQDGTTSLTVPSPTAHGSRKTQEIGMAAAGKFLYVSDRITDTIYRMDLKTGTLLDYFDAPGPYATGLAWDGHILWCADYEARTLYKLHATTSAPYVTYGPKHERVTFTEAWRNFGPGTRDDARRLHRRSR